MRDFLSTLAIPPGVIGWRVCRATLATVKRGRSYVCVTTMEYATGARTWTAEKRRAFLFTTYPAGVGHANAKGLNHGLRWAREHRDSFPQAKWERLYIVRVSTPRARKAA